MNWDAPAFYQILETPNKTFKAAAVFISTYLSLNTQLPSPTPIERIDLFLLIFPFQTLQSILFQHLIPRDRR